MKNQHVAIIVAALFPFAGAFGYYVVGPAVLEHSSFARSLSAHPSARTKVTEMQQIKPSESPAPVTALNAKTEPAAAVKTPPSAAPAEVATSVVATPVDKAAVGPKITTTKPVTIVGRPSAVRGKRNKRR